MIGCKERKDSETKSPDFFFGQLKPRLYQGLYEMRIPKSFIMVDPKLTSFLGGDVTEAYLFSYIATRYFYFRSKSYHPEKYFCHSLEHFEKHTGLGISAIRRALTSLKQRSFIFVDVIHRRGCLKATYFAPNIELVEELLKSRSTNVETNIDDV